MLWFRVYLKYVFSYTAPIHIICQELCTLFTAYGISYGLVWIDFTHILLDLFIGTKRTRASIPCADVVLPKDLVKSRSREIQD